LWENLWEVLCFIPIDVFVVVLMENGDVYSFGSNQFGQLGTGDTAMR